MTTNMSMMMTIMTDVFSAFTIDGDPVQGSVRSQQLRSGDFGKGSLEGTRPSGAGDLFDVNKRGGGRLRPLKE
jgi:hypothetical protein